MKQINLRIPDELLEQLNQQADRSRNAYIVNLIKADLAGNRPPPPTPAGTPISRTEAFRRATQRRS